MTFDKDFDIILERIPSSTIHKIRVDDKVPKEALKIAIDQLILLSKSELWTYVVDFLYNTMETYDKLPAEKQIRTLPEEVKYYYKEWIQLLKNDAEIYEDYKKQSRPAMLINDENDTENKTVLDSDYLDIDLDDDVEIDDILEEMDFEITELHNTIEEELDTDGVLDILQEWNDIVKQDEKGVLESMNDTREIFDHLKETYPHDRGIAQLLWEIHKEGRTYTTTHIIFTEKEFEELRERYEQDSTIRFLASRHYIQKAKIWYYLIRTTRDM